MFLLRFGTDVDYGVDVASFSAPDLRHCMRMCVVFRTHCNAVVFRDDLRMCYVKPSHATAVPSAGTHTAIWVRRVAPPSQDTLLLRAYSASMEVLMDEFSLSSGGLVSSASDIMHAERTTAEECLRMCVAMKECRSVVFLNGEMSRSKCWLKRERHANMVASTDASYTTYVRKPEYLPTEPGLVLYGVLAGPKYIRTRLSVAIRTWLRHEHFIVFIEEEYKRSAMALLENLRAGSNATLRRVVGLSTPPEDGLRSLNGAWKNLAVMRHLAQHFPERRWFAVVDDDTFVVVRNLNFFLQHDLGDDTSPLYLGDVRESALPPPNSVPFVQGGAGIVMNQAAARAILPHLNESRHGNCFAVCRHPLACPGDIRLGCCFARAGVAPTAERGFWHQSVFEALGRDSRPAVSNYPITFHTMRRSQWVDDLQAAIDGQLRYNESGVITWGSLVHQYRKEWRGRYPDEWFAHGAPKV